MAERRHALRKKSKFLYFGFYAVFHYFDGISAKNVNDKVKVGPVRLIECQVDRMASCREQAIFPENHNSVFKIYPLEDAG